MKTPTHMAQLWKLSLSARGLPFHASLAVSPSGKDSGTLIAPVTPEMNHSVQFRGPQAPHLLGISGLRFLTLNVSRKAPGQLGLDREGCSSNRGVGGWTFPQSAVMAQGSPVLLAEHCFQNPSSPQPVIF